MPNSGVQILMRIKLPLLNFKEDNIYFQQGHMTYIYEHSFYKTLTKMYFEFFFKRNHFVQNYFKKTFYPQSPEKQSLSFRFGNNLWFKHSCMKCNDVHVLSNCKSNNLPYRYVFVLLLFTSNNVFTVNTYMSNKPLYSFLNLNHHFITLTYVQQSFEKLF